MPAAASVVWRDPKDHRSFCYFWLTDAVAEFQKKEQ